MLKRPAKRLELADQLLILCLCTTETADNICDEFSDYYAVTDRKGEGHRNELASATRNYSERKRL